MSVEKYINDLQAKKDISFMQLAKEIGITYQNMMDLKNGRIGFFSLKVLDKIAKYEHKDKVQVILDSIYDPEEFDESSYPAIRYLCKQYVDGYSITFHPNYPNPFKAGVIKYDGMLTKKRVSNNYTAVDSWETLKKEHWDMFRVKTKIEYSRDAYALLFMNEAMYISNVIQYANSKIELNPDETVRSYVIVVGKEVAYDIPMIKNYLPTKTKGRITVIEELNNKYVEI